MSDTKTLLTEALKDAEDKYRELSEDRRRAESELAELRAEMAAKRTDLRLLRKALGIPALGHKGESK